MRFGIDIGGSHIGIGLVDNLGHIVDKKEKDFSKEDKKDMKKTIFYTTKEYIIQILEQQKITLEKIQFIGIAYPASLRNGKIGSSVNLGLNGFEIVEFLEECFKIPVYIKNDAKCAAICEKEFGSLKEFKNAIFLTIGTGIGGGVFLDHKLLTSETQDLFKVGHMVIHKDGQKCKCRRNGCFENYASITALKSKIKESYGLNHPISGRDLHHYITKHIQERKMQDQLDLYIQNLTIGLSNLINLFEPEAIAFGGSFAYYEDILFEKLKKKLKENNEMFQDSYPKLMIATMKNDAGIIGASRINQ